MNVGGAYAALNTHQQTAIARWCLDRFHEQLAAHRPTSGPADRLVALAQPNKSRAEFDAAASQLEKSAEAHLWADLDLDDAELAVHDNALVAAEGFRAAALVLTGRLRPNETIQALRTMLKGVAAPDGPWVVLAAHTGLNAPQQALWVSLAPDWNRTPTALTEAVQALTAGT